MSTGVSRYNRTAHFGVPAVQAQQKPKSDSFEAHCLDSLRQSHEKRMDWDIVKSLLDEGHNLTWAKQETMRRVNSDPYA